jgi:hypothetical protein
MKTKLFNLKYTQNSILDFTQDYNNTYKNLINSTSNIAPLAYSFNYATSYTFTTDTTYPHTNIFNDYSIYSFSRGVNQNISGVRHSGFTLNGTGNFDSLMLQFNKDGPLSQTNWDGQIYVYIRNKVTTEPHFGFRYTKATTVQDPYESTGISGAGKPYYILDISNCLSIKEGFLYFTSEHVKQLDKVYQIGAAASPLGLTQFNFNDYFIDIEFTASTNTSMEISNIFVGKTVDFYVNGSLDFTSDNLNKYESSPRVGKTFQQTNKYIKSLSFSLNPINANKLNNYYKSFISGNKDTPFFLLPYAEEELNVNEETGFGYSPYSYLTQIQKDFQIRNLLQGGLYYFNSVDDLKNSAYNVFNMDVKLREYK